MLSILTIITILIILLCVDIYRKCTFSVTSIVILFYLLVAIAGIFVYKERAYTNLNFFPSLYFAFICFIFFLPLMSKRSLVVNGFHIQKTRSLSVVLIVYVLFAFFNIIDQLNFLKSALIGGNFAALKQMAYGGEISLRNGFFWNVSRTYVSSLWMAVMLYGFYILKDDNQPFLKGFSYILLGILPEFITCIVYTYRGGIGVIALLVISAYFLFKNVYSLKRKIQLRVLFIILFLLLLSIIIAITVSRFGDAGAGSSFVSYLGQSMINFNANVASRIHSFANGKYFFANFYNMTVDDVCRDYLYGIESNNGANLHTFVGNLVLDFGFIGGVIAALTSSTISFLILCNKRKYDFADASFLMFYISFLCTGAFHSKCGFSFDCMAFFTIYAILKISNLKFKLGSIHDTRY